MIINHNVPAMQTNAHLAKNNKATSKSLNKLSSGMKINTAADDASGLAISEKMRSQIRGLDQASANAQDGISLIQTAEGNLSETEDILQRIRELADKSANDTAVASDRNEIQKEVNQLTNEINRIGNTTEFNTMKLLNGGGSETKIGNELIDVGARAGTMDAAAMLKDGVTEALGEYTVTMAASYAAGATLQIGDQVFSVVDGDGDAAAGKIGRGVSGTATQMIGNLLDAIRQNEALSNRFTVTSNGANILTFEEKEGQATGKALTVGAGLSTASTTSSVKEELGEYLLNIKSTIQLAGSTITVFGQTLTATNAADPGAGQFKISDNLEEQAKSIANAINTQATLGKQFKAVATANGGIKLIQRAGEGVTMTAGSIGAAQSTAAALGKFNVSTKTLVENGGKFTVDGVDIAVVTDKSDRRLSTGEAILAAESMKDQTNRLVAAINANSALKDKYTAGVSGEKLQLTQKAGYQNLREPVVTSNTSSKDGFEAKLQIGANSFQSMTVKIDDMRAEALGVVGTESGQKVVSEKGNTAYYTAIQNVNNGTTDENVEYALDIGTHEKATAALDILDQAINKVSAERSKLGAFQNRLEHTINNLGTSSQNMTEAESRIRDTDMAKEMMTFQKNNILSQAAQSMLAQANQLPQGVLQLLK